MSGRRATPTHTNRRTATRAASFVLCAAACGLLSTATILGGGTAAAQPPQQPTQLEDIGKNAAEVDPKQPVPADAPRRPPHAKFAVPDLDRKMFAEIEDFKPVAAETQNALEYQAWCEVVTHAKKFTTAELEQYAARDLTPIDLIKPRFTQDVRKPAQSLFRCELVRFDGQLICVRRLPAPLVFQNNPDLGVKELYEARLVPVDESPLTPVSIVSTELPEALKAVLQKPAGEWTGTDSPQWISAAGYYFKTMNVPGEQGTAVVRMPVLIGKSVTFLSGVPTPPGDDPTAIDKNVRVYKFIKDKTKIASRPKLTDPFEVPWEEPAAYDRVVRHAYRFSAEELEKHARTDVKFADLFEDQSAPGYRLQLVKLEGRLISLRRFDPALEVKASGVEHMYEGWLVPANEPRGNPVSIVFTEPLEGVPANGRVNKWVSFAGYSFKKLRYTSAEEDPKHPSKNIDKYAPLLIGKSPLSRPDPDAPPTGFTWGTFVLGAVIGGALLIATAGLFTWYYRRGDRQAKRAMNAVRNRNPFDATNAPSA